MSGSRPLASLSIDVDNLWTYQMVHGNPAWQDFGTYLPVVVPRLLSVLERHELTLTAFIVGKDAERPENVDAIAQLVAAGHEIGNHSYRHQPWLHRYSPAELHEELEAAEDAIVRCGAPRPTGFRGPGYSLSEDTLRGFSGRIREKRLVRGETLFHRGAPAGDGFWVIVLGQIKLAFPATNGNEKVLTKLGAKQSCGEAQMLLD